MARIFIGVHFTPEMQAVAGDWQTANKMLPVRWIEPKNMHITLIPPFAGEPQEILDRAGGLRGIPAPFDIDFEGVTFGPNPRAPRLIWAYGMPPVEILELKKELENVFTEVPREKREFRLHATLARFEAEDFRKFPVRQLHESVSWSMRVREFTVFESKLSRAGADYTVLGNIPLA